MAYLTCMQIEPPKRQIPSPEKKLEKRYVFFENLVRALNKHEIPDDIVAYIHTEVNQLNATSDNTKGKAANMKAAANRIIKRIHKELNLVPRNYNRNLWMGIGMAAFGVPLGVAFGTSMQNMSFIGIGIPLGLIFGVSIGTNLDKKAKENGTQLDMDYEL